MKRDHFEELKAVIAKIKPNEVRTARKFITAFEGNATKGKNKSLLLFELILKESNASKDDILNNFGSDSKTRSLEKLAERLKSKILESLTLNVNINRHDLYGPHYRVDKKLRKLLTEANIACAREMKNLALNIYDEIIDKAKEFEMYKVLIEALMSKQQILGFTSGRKDYYKYSEELKLYQRCDMAVMKAMDWYHRHFMEVDYVGLNNDKVALLMAALTDLEKEYKATNSINVGYFYYVLQMEYYLALENYARSCEIGYKLVKLIRNKSHFSKAMRGGVHSDLADNELFVYKFISSVKNSKNGLALFKIWSRNYLITLEVQFRAYYYQGDIENSTQITSILLESTDAAITPFHHSKRVYLQACAHFVKAEYKEAQQHLHSTKEIENDKEGWNIGKRLLTILIHLEQDDWDQAETAITNLRMHIQRLKPEGTVRHRDAVILKVLQKLVLDSFDYQQVLDKHPALFEQLDRTDRDYRWQVKSPEMVVFHHWFQDKAQGIPYQFRVPEPLMLKFGAKSPAVDLEI